MNATATKRRTVRLTENGWLVLHQEDRNGIQADAYLLKPIAGGYELSKTDGTLYRVLGLKGKASCNCKGFRFHGHCKHCESMQALDAAGRLF